MKNESRKKGLVKKKTMHFLYGAGGAVVIVGALFKILHLEYGPLTGSLMLSIGLGTEAFIFLLGSIDFSEIEDGVVVDSKGFAFLEEDKKNEVVSTKSFDFLEVDGIEIEASVLEGEEPSLKEELTGETEKVLDELHGLSYNISELSGVYADMISVIKKK